MPPSTPARVALTVAGLALANIAAGRLIVGPLRDLPAEHALSRHLHGRRTPSADRLAGLLSRSSDTSRAIAVGIAVAGLLAWRRRDPRAAATPALAMATASAVHVISSSVVRRGRPALDRLGTRQPTSSFPSGHVGAMTALSVVIGRAVAPLPAPVRTGIRAGLAGYLALLGWSRVHSAQHYATDVLAGYANGLACGQLAWRTVSAFPTAPTRTGTPRRPRSRPR